MRSPRDVTDAIKRNLTADQGVSVRDYELDHIVPLDLGGAPLVSAVLLERLMGRHELPEIKAGDPNLEAPQELRGDTMPSLPSLLHLLGNAYSQPGLASHQTALIRNTTGMKRLG